MDNSKEFYIAESPSLEDNLWIDFLQKRAGNSIQILEDTAKQYITITSFSQTVYFASISFSLIKKSLFLFSPYIRFLVIVLLILPLICWIYSLICASRTFSYKISKSNPQSPRAAKELYDELLFYKSRRLKQAFLGLISGFICLIIDIVCYLQFFPIAKDN